MNITRMAATITHVVSTAEAVSVSVGPSAAAATAGSARAPNEAPPPRAARRRGAARSVPLNIEGSSLVAEAPCGDSFPTSQAVSDAEGQGSLSVCREFRPPVSTTGRKPLYGAANGFWGPRRRVGRRTGSGAVPRRRAACGRASAVHSRRHRGRRVRGGSPHAYPVGMRPLRDRRAVARLVPGHGDVARPREARGRARARVRAHLPDPLPRRLHRPRGQCSAPEREPGARAPRLRAAGDGDGGARRGRDVAGAGGDRHLAALAEPARRSRRGALRAAHRDAVHDRRGVRGRWRPRPARAGGGHLGRGARGQPDAHSAPAVLIRKVVSAGFIASGILHFTHTRWYESIMPPYVPRHRESVLVSGVAEAVGGAGVLLPATR